MEFTTKFAIVIDQDLVSWQKLNVIAFLTSGLTSQNNDIIGEAYKDSSGKQYSPLCVQPIVILKSSREKLQTFLQRANNKKVSSAIFIEDMFTTGHDSVNRQVVAQYPTTDLPLVGMCIRAEKKLVDKIFKGAKLHE
jgi:hypothetical protein